VDSDAKYAAVFKPWRRRGDLHPDWLALKLPETRLLRDPWKRKDVGAIDGGQ
jgi:hypothetical protein